MYIASHYVDFSKVEKRKNRRCGSNEYPQCMFWVKNKKIRYTPANPSFFYI